MRRLNLGSGSWYAPGWVNVDLHPPPKGCRAPDIYGSVFELEKTFEDTEPFQEAYLGHFLEHLEWHRIPEAIDQVCRVMVPGGTIMVVGPCIKKAAEFCGKNPGHDWLLDAILADPRQPPTGHGHAWTPTEELTRVALEESGLVDVQTVPIESVKKPEWPNPSCAGWQTAASGKVPS